MPFKPGQSGNPKGRVKGPIKSAALDVRKMQASVNARALDQLEGMMAMANTVIEEALADGNIQTAQWLVDKMTAKGGVSMLPEAIKLTLSTMDDVMKAAQAIAEMCMARKLSLDDAQKGLTMLSQYASFRAFERIDELKAMVEEMQGINAKTIDGTTNGTLPSWGRLSDATPVANSTPAE